MPSRYGGITGTEQIANDYENINIAFENVEADVDAKAAIVTNHINSTTAHSAEHITYSGSAAGTNVKEAVDGVNDRVNEIIQGGGPDKDAELVDIRTPDPSYTPQRTINVAGDITRDMQAQFGAQLADIAYNVKSFGAVGDGVADDTAAIQSAVNAANAAGGGVVYFPPGNYLVSSHITLYSKIIIRGTRGSTIRVQSPYNDKILSAVGTSLSPLSDITIECISIIGNGEADTNSTNEFAWVENLWIREARIFNTRGFNPIQVHNCTGVHLLNNDVESPAFSDCMALSGSHHCEIIGNRCYDPYDTGIVVAAGCSHITVIGNTVERVSDGLANAQSIAVADAKFVTVTSNVIKGHGNSQAGIRAYPDPNTLGLVSDVVISDNTIDGTGAAVVMSNVNRGTLTGNAAEKSGILVYDSNYITFNGNSVMNSEDSGIILLGCTHCVIQGNVSSDDQDQHTQKFGIRLLDDGDVKSDKNIVVGNNVSGNTTLQIQLAGSLGTDVAYNNIGYNPIGYLPTPAVPATQTPMTNVYGSPVDVYVYGGTVTEIYKNGMLITGMTSGKLTLYPGETISLTYSAAPSWTWFGL